MGTKLKKSYCDWFPLSCLVCGVDSGPVLSFFVWMVGAGVLASLCFLVWALQSKKFKNVDELADTPLIAEDIHNG